VLLPARHVGRVDCPATKPPRLTPMRREYLRRVAATGEPSVNVPRHWGLGVQRRTAICPGSSLLRGWGLLSRQDHLTGAANERRGGNGRLPHR
jgi:hypothetical protein